MSTTTAQQRRGKASTAKSEATTTVSISPDGAASGSPSGAGLLVGTSTASISTGRPPAIAVVRRQFCGTGPFDKHWLNLDCCGLFCALLTYCLHIYGVYAVCIVILPPWMSYMVDDVRYFTLWGHLHRFAFTSVAVLAVVSHFKAMTTDPGAVPPDARPLEEDLIQQQKDLLEPPPTNIANASSPSSEAENLLTSTPLQPPRPQQQLRLCRRCKAFKPQRAHHCSVCRRCIIKMDHHCPWINNCCAVGNHKYFLLFIFYTFLSCTYSISLVILRFASCMGDHHHPLQSSQSQRRRVACLDRPADLLAVLGLLVEALLFGMFTSCMMFDQASVVTSRVTHIDRLKGIELGGAVSGIAEVFGIGSSYNKSRGAAFSASAAQTSRFRLDWLSPWAKVCYDGFEQEIMGFCRPVSSQQQQKQPVETELISRSRSPGKSVQESV